MRYVRKSKVAEEILEDLSDIIKDKLKKASLKSFVEHGFYASAGILTWLSLDRVEAPPRTEPKVSRDLTGYALSEWRGGIVKLLEAGGTMAGADIFGIKPFFMLNPVQRLYDVACKKEVDNKNYMKVPSPIRELIALAVPSLMYISKELMQGTVEIGSV